MDFVSSQLSGCFTVLDVCAKCTYLLLSIGHHTCSEPGLTHYKVDKSGGDSRDRGKTETELLSR